MKEGQKVLVIRYGANIISNCIEKHIEDAKNDLEGLRIKEIQKEMSVIDMAEAKQALARVKGL
ncbi:MAG: hypothetical protein IJO85_07055 [Lachnospiraceae bacterium]|nr:hypothetical protein [Lachnospiraceae bacterium]